jgi:hypothetical protein
MAPDMQRPWADATVHHTRYAPEFSGKRGAVRQKVKTNMPVLAKSCGIVLRLLIDRTFGTHVHAFYGDFELVIGLDPLRVIQGDAPSWVREWALGWVRTHPGQLRLARGLDLNLPTPLARQAANCLVFAD